MIEILNKGKVFWKCIYCIEPHYFEWYIFVSSLFSSKKVTQIFSSFQVFHEIKIFPDFHLVLFSGFIFKKLSNLDSGLLFDFRYPNCQMRLSSIKTINKTNYFLSHGAPESLTFHPKIKIIYLNKIVKYQFVFGEGHLLVANYYLVFHTYGIG